MLALDAGADRHKAFLGKLGLLDRLQTEAGPIAAPQLPERFDRISQITMAYGHGIAIAPLQFAASAAALFNGGELVMPTYVRRLPGSETIRVRALKPATSARINELMRLNVTDAAGTGKRADVPGYLVGGKTGTAEIPDAGGYKKSAVISSFLAAFPMNRPQYLVLISLFEPKPSPETGGEIAAAVNAAPSAGRLIRRIAPILGVLPEGTLAAAGD
jgi:cell division protein FtsI (penicillin-binding protein 3)